MKSLIIAAVLMVSVSAYAGGIGFILPTGNVKSPMGSPMVPNYSNKAMQPVKPNTYAPGVGMDATGRAVTLQPSSTIQQGNYSDSYVVKPDAYGPGVHMDQYGRAVQWK